MKDSDDTLREEKIYESCEAANDALGPCPKPLADSDGGHWWYVDQEAEERDAEDEIVRDYILCECKTCPQKMKLSVDAEEYPV